MEPRLAVAFLIMLFCALQGFPVCEPFGQFPTMMPVEDGNPKPETGLLAEKSLIVLFAALSCTPTWSS
jgi:hypothetical protein